MSLAWWTYLRLPYPGFPQGRQLITGDLLLILAGENRGRPPRLRTPNAPWSEWKKMNRGRLLQIPKPRIRLSCRLQRPEHYAAALKRSGEENPADLRKNSCILPNQIVK